VAARPGRPRRVKAAYRRGEEVFLKERELRALGPNEIRLRVLACGICGSDLHVDPKEAAEEQPFGHEVAGEVLEVGAGVEHLEAGRKVVLDSATPCGRCDACRNMRQELCTDIQSFWFTGYFGLAEEMIVPAISVIPCEGLAPEIACLQEPLGVAIDLVRLAEVTPDSNCLVMGPGPIGLMAVALVRRAGARRLFVSAFEKEKERVALARRFGADDVIDPSKAPLAEHGFGCGIDRVLVTTPPPTLADAFKVASKGGIVSFIGIGFGEAARCEFDANEFHFKKLALRASFASPALFGPRALECLRRGVVDGAALVSHRFPLEDIGEAMATARDRTRAVKVVVTP
jgi:threonine dehydrogenase-like Zn-dependent dehydrogenase